MCRVLNARIVGKAPAPGRVYVGRPGKWGNPFVIGRDGSRAEDIAKYRAWLSSQPEVLDAGRTTWQGYRLLVRATAVPWRRSDRTR